MVATVALGDVAKHNAVLAQKVAMHPGTLKVLVGSLQDRDLELRQHACGCLGHIAKHTEELAQAVVNAGLFPSIITHCLKEERLVLQKQAVQCVKEVACQSVGLSKLVVDAGVLPAITGYLAKATGAHKLPAIMTLGFVAGFDVALAQAVIKSGAHKLVIEALRHAKLEPLQSAAAWSLGQIGRHNVELGNVLASDQAMDALLAAYLSAAETSDLRKKTKRALKNLIRQCQELRALKSLVDSNSEKIAKHVVAQMAVLLNATPSLKYEFAESGCLQRLQQLTAPPGSKLLESITAIHKLFPDDVLAYFKRGRLQEIIKQEHDYHHPPE